MKHFIASLAALAVVAPGAASADSWQATAHVTMVEASHVGYGYIYFTIDQSVGNCPAGAYLNWSAGGNDEAQQIANGQAIFATLLTAKVTGQTIRVVGDQNGCMANLLYFPQ